MEWYTILFFASLLAFAVQGILSLLGTEFDLDASSGPDFDMGDLFSFKGIVHFCIGFSGWLNIGVKIWGHLCIVEYITAIIIGAIFMLILYFSYKLIHSNLEHVPSNPTLKDFVGQRGKIYLTSHNREELIYYITVTFNGKTEEVVAFSHKFFRKGEEVTIQEYKDGKLYI